MVVEAPDRIRQALASLHKHERDDGEKHFLASGVFIAPRTVLTAKHVFEKRRPTAVWVRPQSDRSPARRIVGDVVEHSTLDAAWFQIEAEPPGATWLDLDMAARAAAGPVYTLNGYFEGRLRMGTQRTVPTFDASARWYLTEPSHGNGLSGAALCLGDRVWAISVERYADPSAVTGCAIAMHQLWDGFLEHVPGIAKRRTPAAPSPATAAAAPPDPLAHDLREQLRRLFASEPLAKWSGLGALDGGIPSRFAAALESREQSRGSVLVSLLADGLQMELHRSLDENELTLDAAAAKRIKRQLLDCMGTAAKLCMHPQQRAALESLRQRIEVPAQTQVGATLAAHPAPLHTLEPVEGSPTRAMRNRYAVAHGLEFGEGVDKRFGLASLIATLTTRKSGPLQKVEIRSETEWHEWRGYLRNERDQKRGRSLMLSRAARDSLGEDMERWLDDLGVTVIVLAGDDCGFFWFEEALLVGKVQGFLSQFQTHPAWKDANAAP